MMSDDDYPTPKEERELEREYLRHDSARYEDPTLAFGAAQSRVQAVRAAQAMERLRVALRVREISLEIIEDLYAKGKLGASVLVPMLQYADETERADSEIAQSKK